MNDQIQISEPAVLQPSGGISPRMDGHLYMLQREGNSGSYIGLTVTDNDYKTVFWPTLKETVTILLLRDGADRISYEHNYSCVYKCVCNGYAEALYSDLHELVESLCAQLNSDLHGSLSSLNNVQFVQQFATTLLRVREGLRGIVAIFNYLNRSLRSVHTCSRDLGHSLLQSVIQNFVDRQITRVVSAMVECSSKPMSVDPNLMYSLARELQELKPEYVDLRPQLFARFLPGVLPPASSIDQLDAYRNEALRMQRDLLANPAFVAHGDVTRKRSFEESNAAELQSQPSAAPSTCSSASTLDTAPVAGVEARDLRVVSVSPDGSIREGARTNAGALEPPRRVRVQDADSDVAMQVQDWSATAAVARLALARAEPPNDTDTDMVDGLNNNGND